MTHVLVIGAYGSAGVAVADTLVSHVGDDIDRLTLVDDGDPAGGLCILRGCMPSKELLSAAGHHYQARHDHRLVGETPAMDLDAIVETKDEHISNFAAHRRAAVEKMAKQDSVELVRERARFVGERKVRAGDHEFDPDYVVVATGSSQFVPDLPGIDDVEYLTSADVLDATALPESGVVMGFGYIGLELVPYLAEAGVDLTVVEHDERPLDEADPAFGDEILDIYREEFGVEVRTNVYEERIEQTDEGVRLHLDDGSSIDAESLFLFTGRKPNVDGLNLDATGITPEGEWVDASMQATATDGVFVVGDANGREPILHVAKEQGFVAADNVLAAIHDEAFDEYHNVHHHVIFSGATVYPYARVGHSAASAADAGIDHVVVSREARDDGVFKTKATPRGLARLVVGTDGTVLGYQGLHYHADVMAKTMHVAVEMELDVRDLPDRAYHPTTPEILDSLFRNASAELDD
ncbi:dihydrolipoyl dehydrogenase family protein [Haloferax profundi]|uniref:Pyridine nucleotide-disulfide oxidoreductase n=1 Tax=Haloferax profundi TaxID=1544718 RepID=A0A0W1S2R6_9EURY|nr:NAD(P)/FAD-dependent oxidoreductase [Haloferax profundi]KTG20256.1 pyridine nucleotide-disulfide oxidoreductase [Haloferax profundi]